MAAVVLAIEATVTSILVVWMSPAAVLMANGDSDCGDKSGGYGCVGCRCDDDIYFAMNNSVRMLISKLLFFSLYHYAALNFDFSQVMLTIICKNPLVA